MPGHPLQQVLKGDPVSQRQRLDLIRPAVTDDRVPLRTRVAACLMLLYAQPVSRLIRLTTDDVIQQDSQVLIRLGDPPAPVPEPFAALLLELAGHQPGITTASTPTRWLFPGQSAGQPLAAGTMLAHLRTLGFLTGPARLSALRQLVLQAPAPVIARSLGYHDNTTTRIAAEAGKTWNQYAPGDHAQWAFSFPHHTAGPALSSITHEQRSSVSRREAAPCPRAAIRPFNELAEGWRWPSAMLSRRCGRRAGRGHRTPHPKAVFPVRYLLTFQQGIRPRPRKPPGTCRRGRITQAFGDDLFRAPARSTKGGA